MKQEIDIEKVQAFIRKLDRDGTSPVRSKNPEASRFRKVSIPMAEGEALRKWIISERATQTIEIGLAYGYSALYMCLGLLESGGADPKHVVIDPWQSIPSGYADCGIDNLRAAGVGDLVEYHEEKSQILLPRLVDANRRFDLAFVDGNHRFDAVFLDLYFLGQLVRKSGIIIVDDYDLPGISRAVSFYLKNLNWTIEETATAANHTWAVLRTAQEDDSRDFRHFVDF